MLEGIPIVHLWTACPQTREKAGITVATVIPEWYNVHKLDIFAARKSLCVNCTIFLFDFFVEVLRIALFVSASHYCYLNGKCETKEEDLEWLERWMKGCWLYVD